MSVSCCGSEGPLVRLALALHLVLVLAFAFVLALVAPGVDESLALVVALLPRSHTNFIAKEPFVLPGPVLAWLRFLAHTLDATKRLAILVVLQLAPDVAVLLATPMQAERANCQALCCAATLVATLLHWRLLPQEQADRGR